MLNFRNYRFWGSAFDRNSLPKDELPEVAIIGRSNVGKSSLINTLLGSKKAARISKTPGKTRMINFYRIDEKIYLADLPGYGFARISHTERERWKRTIESYLKENDRLKLVILLIDSRHETFKSDKVIKEWLDYFNIPCQIIATKVDKLSKNRAYSIWQKNLKDFGLKENEKPIFFSALTGEGKKDLINIIEKIIE